MNPSFLQEIEDSVHELPGNLKKPLMRIYKSQNVREPSNTSESLTQFQAYSPSYINEVSEYEELLVPSKSQPSLGEVSNSSSTHNIHSKKFNMSPKKLIIG